MDKQFLMANQKLQLLSLYLTWYACIDSSKMATFLISKHFGCVISHLDYSLTSDFAISLKTAAGVQFTESVWQLWLSSQPHNWDVNLSFFSDVRQIQMQFWGCGQLGTVFIFFSRNKVAQGWFVVKISSLALLSFSTKHWWQKAPQNSFVHK